MKFFIICNIQFKTGSSINLIKPLNMSFATIKPVKCSNYMEQVFTICVFASFLLENIHAARNTLIMVHVVSVGIFNVFLKCEMVFFLVIQTWGSNP